MAGQNSVRSTKSTREAIDFSRPELENKFANMRDMTNGSATVQFPDMNALSRVPVFSVVAQEYFTILVQPESTK